LNLEGVMAGTEQHEEQVSAPDADYTGLLRAVTVERFTAWKPPESATDRAASLGHQLTKTPWANTSDVPNVRGRVHDDKNGNKPGRTR
jgi:hypothetical protein